VKKVIVIGCPGSGKTTFSEKLRRITGLTLYHLDAIWHKPDKTHIPREEFDQRICEIFASDRWIIDGNYNRTIEMRLRECDTVFLFDLPAEVCLQGATERLGKGRYDLPWIETEPDPEFEGFIKDFAEQSLPKIYDLIEAYKEEKQVVIFHSRAEADAYLEALKGGVKRCSWCNLNNPLYVAYHDNEWGVPDFTNGYLYQMLILESFQAGLSWECVLNKREAFREAYDGFDLEKVCTYGENKIEELLANKRLIRNRLKIRASIENSKIFLSIVKEYGSFYKYLQTFTHGEIIFETGKTVSALSGAISRDLQKRGMKFVGSTIIYSYLQAVGIIRSHEKECFLYRAEPSERAYRADVKLHYDRLIDEENDPFRDPPALREYMDRWDGKPFLDALKLQKTKTVLEIGVGTGRLAARVAPFCCHFTGIDLSPKTVERAKDNLKDFSNVTLICDDFCTCKSKGQYDVIYSSLTLMHFENKDAFMEKVASLLKHNGIFCLSIDKSEKDLIDMGDRNLRIFPDTPKKTRESIRKAGMRIENEAETEAAFIFVCRK